VIRPADLYESLVAQGFTYFSGVPDSLLAELCAVMAERVPPENHVVSANEGGAVALAAGYHLATGGLPVVYLQNSGTGNIVNPLLSLVDPAVFRIPILFVIGWRGEPGVPDEPQHVTQGRVTPALLQALGLKYDVLDGDTDIGPLLPRVRREMVENDRSHALLVRRGTFAAHGSPSAPREGGATRREALAVVLGALHPTDLVVSTTGMTSREVYAIRDERHEGHRRDFLTVGSMGHCSQIALGIAQHAPGRDVYCLDGDGAVLMHMGSLAIIGTQRPPNLRHVVINNGAHDSVGGQPTAARGIDLCAVARACGYRTAEAVDGVERLAGAVERLRASTGPALLEIRVASRAHTDAGRPTTSPVVNKADFMAELLDGRG
jgi:phosphonopyruvate decarboxylase